ncbi:MAG: hypothetical protein Q9169_007307 [Polycauliona sp. 2 TL-2023]
MVSSSSSASIRETSPAASSLDTLVSHLVASKRSLSSIEHVWRANEIVTSTRLHLETSVITSARTSFLRAGITTQLGILERVHANSKAIEAEGAEEYGEVLRTLDEADNRLRGTLASLSNTVVEHTLRPESDQRKNLLDFVDEGGVDKLLAAVEESAHAAKNAHTELVDTNLGFNKDLSRILDIIGGSAALLSKRSAGSLHSDTTSHGSPLPHILQSMEDRAKEMADNLESLVKHFDLCVTAIKHTEGGGDAAQRLTDDLPEGMDVGQEIASAPPEPITDQEREEMMGVLANDADQVEEVLAEIRAHINEMESLLEDTTTYMAELDEENSNVLKAFRLLESLEGRLHAFVAQSQVFVMRWDDEKSKINERMNELESLGDFYSGYLSAYDNLLVEIGRRQFMEQQMEKVLQDAMRKLDTLHEEDSMKREAFKTDYGDFLPVDIWPGLTNSPLRFETAQVSGTERVPDISKSVIQRAIHRVEGKMAMHKQDQDKNEASAIATDQSPSSPVQTDHFGSSSFEKDAAAAIVSDHAVTLDKATVRRVQRKIDWFLIPIMWFGYGLVYYDKAILGSAVLFGMTGDLNLRVIVDPSTTPPTASTQRLSWATSMFYFGMLAGLYPLTFLLQRFNIGRVLCGVVILWGLICMLTATVTSWQGLFAQRFFLGFVESIIPTGFMCIVSGYYTQEEQALRQSWWFSSTGAWTIIGGALNYGFAQITGGSLKRWQYIYLLAGALTILFGCVCFWIPNSAVDAWFLSKEERVVAVERLRKGQTGVRCQMLKGDQLKEAILDVKIWLVFFMMAAAYTVNGAVSGFGPLIVSTFGYNTLESILLQFPLGAIVFIFVLFTGYLSSRIRNINLILLILCCLPVIAGCAMIWKSDWYLHAPTPVAGYTIIGFFGPVVFLIINIGMANVAGATKKSFTAAAIFVAYCVGNIVGPQLIKTQHLDRHYPELWTGLIICYCIVILLSILLYLHLRNENRKRDRHPGDEAERDKLAFQDLTDKQNPYFRYVL